ncbi:MAG: TetR/AcrR family transcriptional regulator [Anaerovoracaceae bacterium]
MGTEHSTMRRRQAIQSKQKIAKTAISLFRKYGYNSVTINDICKKANVSVGTFYHYFETKGAVFKTVIEDIDHRLFQYIDHAGSESSKLNALLDFVIYFARSHMEIEIDILTIWLSPEFQAIGDQAGEKTFVALLQLVESGQETGEIMTDLSAESIAQQIFIGTKGLLYDWCLHQGSYDLMARIDEYCTLLSRALSNNSQK